MYASWTSLGRLLAALGRLLDPLGRFLATSWALSGATWLISGAFWVHFSSPRRSGPRFWRVWEHAGLGFRRLGRHVLACRSLRLAFHDIMLFVTSAWPWPVSCQQDLPKCFLNWAVWATCFYRCSTHAFAITCALPSSLLVRRFVRSTSAASRRDAERARFKVQVPNLASTTFHDLKSLALKAYPKLKHEVQA